MRAVCLLSLPVYSYREPSEPSLLAHSSCGGEMARLLVLPFFQTVRCGPQAVLGTP